MMWSKKESPLIQAVIENKIERVKQLLTQEGMDRVDDHGFNSLEIAQFLGYDKIAALLNPSQDETIIKITFPEVAAPIECSKIDLKAMLGITYRSHLHFASYKIFKDTLHQCPWILNLLKHTEENKSLYEKYFANIKKGEGANTEVKWVNEIMGFGLFAAQDFAKEVYIGEYVGEVRQLHRLHLDYNDYCFHYPTRWWSYKYMMIDALKTGNELRFINHSDFPNIDPCCIVDRGLLHLFFIANREIKSGEELTFDYGADYWDS